MVEGLEFTQSHQVQNQPSEGGVMFTNGPEITRLYLTKVEMPDSLSEKEGEEIRIPIITNYSASHGERNLDSMPVSIMVDGMEATKGEQYSVDLYGEEEFLVLTCKEGNIPWGTYEIECTIPGNYMENGQE